MDVIRAMLLWTTFIQTKCVEWIKLLPDAASSFTRTISMGPAYPTAAVTKPPFTVLLSTQTAANACASLKPITANISFDEFLRDSPSAYADYSTRFNYTTTDVPLSCNSSLAIWPPHLDTLLTLAICCCALLLYRYRYVLCALIVIATDEPKPVDIPGCSDPSGMTKLIFSFRTFSDLYSDGAFSQDQGYATRSQADYVESAAFWDFAEELQGKLDQRDQEIEDLSRKMLDESNLHALCEFFKDQELRHYRSREKSTGMRLAESSTPGPDGEESRALIRRLRVGEMVTRLQAALAKKLEPSSELQEQNKQLSDSNTALQKALRDLQENVAALGREKEEQQQSIEQLKRDASSATEAMARVTQLEQKASEDAETISDLQSALSRAQTDASTLSGQIADEKDLREKAAQKHSDAMKNITADHEKRLKQLDADKSVALEQAHTARDEELALVRDKIAELEAENNVLSTKLIEAEEAASQAGQTSVIPESQAAQHLSHDLPSEQYSHDLPSEQHDSPSFGQLHDTLASHISKGSHEIAANLENDSSLSLCTYCRCLIYNHACFDAVCIQKHTDAQQMVAEPAPAMVPRAFTTELSLENYAQACEQIPQAPIGNAGAHQNPAISFEESGGQSCSQDSSQVFGSGCTQGAAFTAAMPTSDAQDSMNTPPDHMEVDLTSTVVAMQASTHAEGSGQFENMAYKPLKDPSPSRAVQMNVELDEALQDSTNAEGSGQPENVICEPPKDFAAQRDDQASMGSDVALQTPTNPEGLSGQPENVACEPPKDSAAQRRDQINIDSGAASQVPSDAEVRGKPEDETLETSKTQPSQGVMAPLAMQAGDQQPAYQKPGDCGSSNLPSIASEETFERADAKTLQARQIRIPKSLKSLKPSARPKSNAMLRFGGDFKPSKDITAFGPRMARPLESGDGINSGPEIKLGESIFACSMCSKVVSHTDKNGRCQGCATKVGGAERGNASSDTARTTSSGPDPKANSSGQGRGDSKAGFAGINDGGDEDEETGGSSHGDIFNAWKEHGETVRMGHRNSSNASSLVPRKPGQHTSALSVHPSNSVRSRHSTAREQSSASNSRNESQGQSDNAVPNPKHEGSASNSELSDPPSDLEDRDEKIPDSRGNEQRGSQSANKDEEMSDSMSNDKRAGSSADMDEKMSDSEQNDEQTRSKSKTSSKAAPPSDNAASRNASTPRAPPQGPSAGHSNKGKGQAKARQAIQGPPAGSQATQPPPPARKCKHCHKGDVGIDGVYCFFCNILGRGRP